MKMPRYAKLLLEKNEIYPVVCCHFKTHQVTLKEKEKVYNTVDIKNVDFDLSGFTETEKLSFLRCFE